MIYELHTMLMWVIIFMAPIALYCLIGELFFAFERAKSKKVHTEKTA
jgi:hypothetical protein